MHRISGTRDNNNKVYLIPLLGVGLELIHSNEKLSSQLKNLIVSLAEENG